MWLSALGWGALEPPAKGSSPIKYIFSNSTYPKCFAVNHLAFPFLSTLWGKIPWILQYFVSVHPHWFSPQVKPWPIRLSSITDFQTSGFPSVRQVSSFPCFSFLPPFFLLYIIWFVYLFRFVTCRPLSRIQWQCYPRPRNFLKIAEAMWVPSGQFYQVVIPSS